MQYNPLDSEESFTNTDCKVSLSTSKVESTPDINSDILWVLISKPTTEYLVAKSLANGKPTYPKPMMAILSFLIFFIIDFPNTISQPLSNLAAVYIVGYNLNFLLLYQHLQFPSPLITGDSPFINWLTNFGITAA